MQKKTRRLAPDNITELSHCEVFVFGSNLEGQHMGGAARYAYDHFGAEWGNGVGPQGRCYAIPTMHGPLSDIKPYVDDFIEYARQHPMNRFLLTRIGCGIAGFKDWIVYHRNPVNGKNKKAAFPLGSLHSHVSGVDITFEDQKAKADDVRYRASALIREFMVTDGDNDQCGPVDIYPTHLYEYLYTQSSLEDIHIQWKPVKFQDNKVHPQPRINVCTYTFDGKTLTKNKGEDDLKEWGFRR